MLLAVWIVVKFEGSVVSDQGAEIGWQSPMHIWLLALFVLSPTLPISWPLTARRWSYPRSMIFQSLTT